MKLHKSLLLLTTLMINANYAQAQQFGALEADIEALKEDVVVLQREAYRFKNNNELAPESSSAMALRIGEMDENLRDVNGQLEQLSNRIKTLDERLTMINRDIDIRIKMLEGQPISGGNGMDEQILPKEKFTAPVAKGAPKSIVRENIVAGDDLPKLKTKSVEKIYQEGLDALKSNKYKLAESRFDSVMRRFAKDKLAGNAQYWLGEVYYAQKEYVKAAKAFANGYKNYHSGVKGPDSLLKLGMTMKEMGKNKEACAAFTSMDNEFPKAENRVKNKAKAEAEALACK